jgi:AraC-like DNA-binding protein
MQRAGTISDFVHRPIGRFSLGDRHLLWCHSASLVGSTHWGHYSEAATADLTERLAFSLHRELASGFDVLMNSQMVEGLDWAAWQALARYVRDQLPEWNRRIRRHAIVHPPGVIGALVGAMLPMLGPSYPFRFFSSLSQALAWLDRPELPAILDEVSAVVDSARQVPPTVRALREELDRMLTNATIESAARALGQSTRTLQRGLRSEGTNFRQELTEARLRTARRLLEESDDKIEAIARRVGCGTSSKLSTLFNRYVGETPTIYRARHRRSS